MNWILVDHKSLLTRVIVELTILAGLACAISHISEHSKFESFQEFAHLNMIASALTIFGCSLLVAYSLCQHLGWRLSEQRNKLYRDRINFVRNIFHEAPDADFAAVFVIRSGVDERVIDKVKQQLFESIGADKLSYFRVI